MRRPARQRGRHRQRRGVIEPQRLPGRRAARAGQLRPLFGQGAGLVDEDLLHRSQALDRIKLLQQHTAPCHATRGGHQRRRRRQGQRAGAADDQHRHGHPDGARWVDDGPHGRGAGGEQQHRPQEGPGPAVGQARLRRALRLRAFHHRDDGFQPGVAAHTLGTHQHRCAQVEAAGHHGRTGWLVDRRRLARQQGLVGARVALFDHAVGREGRAQRHPQQVAWAQVAHADGLIWTFRAIFAHTPGRLGHTGLRGFQRIGGTVAGQQFEVARAEQEADEHRQRIEVDLAAEHAARLEGGAGAGDESDGHAERHRQVHADAAQAQRLPGATEEGRGRKYQHRQAQQPAGPVQQLTQVGRQLARARDIAGRGHHHHLHGAEGGDEEPPQGLPVRLPSKGTRRRSRIGRRAVARSLHRRDERGRPRQGRVPAHGGAVGRTADLGRAHARHAAQRGLDQPGAGRAMQAAELQGRLGQRLTCCTAHRTGVPPLLDGVVEHAGGDCRKNGGGGEHLRGRGRQG